MTAKQAIDQSIMQNEIVHLEWDDALALDLLCESDDSVEYKADYGVTVTEYWGEDEDGNDWRVHLETEMQEVAQ